MKPIIKSFYHKPTFTWSHLVYCSVKKQAAIIDPVLDFNQASGEISDSFVVQIKEYMESKGLDLCYIFETHAHADHITAADWLKNNYPKSMIGIGEGITKVQKVFRNVFNLDKNFTITGSQFDLLLRDNVKLELGKQTIHILHTPGHTDDSISYIIGENIFIGDTLFAPEFGTARCDFPGGESAELYDSIQKIFLLGREKQLYLCHDYPKGGNSPKAFYSSEDQQLNNIHINNKISKQQFIKLRNERDSTLTQPKLILPSIQVNIAAGKLPKKESNGVSYLKIPLKLNFKGTE
jgi:glyoxylase-like metal-dependent hydrolase (beta-lactamase superfamily II)